MFILMGGNEKEAVRLFSVVPADRTGANGHKLKQMRFLRFPNIEKHKFLLRGYSNLSYCEDDGLARVTVEFTPVEILKSQLNIVLGNIL